MPYISLKDAIGATIIKLRLGKTDYPDVMDPYFTIKMKDGREGTIMTGDNGELAIWVNE